MPLTPENRSVGTAAKFGCDTLTFWAAEELSGAGV